MLPDITIQALVGLFKHLYRVKSIPFEWDGKLHLMKVPKSRWRIWLWYVNLIFSTFFTIGMAYRFCSNVFQNNFHLAEGIVGFYVALYEILYSAFLFNSWLYWDRIPNFINQWLLFNRNSSMLSLTLEDSHSDSISASLRLSEGPEIPPEMETDSTDSIIEVHSNKSKYVRHVWKKSMKKVYKRRNRQNLYAAELESLNVFIVIKKLLMKKLKMSQVFEPAVMISVMRNSILSDSIFYAILMARLDKMALIPDKPLWFEIISGIWIAYQAYTTWNNALFYLFVAVLFSHDTNSWLKQSSGSSAGVQLTKAATKRKFDLSLRIYRIMQILNTQFNECNRIFIMLGHKVIIGGCQAAAMFGLFRLFSRINAFSYIMLIVTIAVILGVEDTAYRLFALNWTISERFKISWRDHSVLDVAQQKSLESCKILKIKVWGLYCYQRKTTLRFISILLNQNILMLLL